MDSSGYNLYPDYMYQAFSVAAPTVWNLLPDNVVNSNTLTAFKKQLKSDSPVH